MNLKNFIVLAFCVGSSIAANACPPGTYPEYTRNGVICEPIRPPPLNPPIVVACKDKGGQNFAQILLDQGNAKILLVDGNVAFGAYTVERASSGNYPTGNLQYKIQAQFLNPAPQGFTAARAILSGITVPTFGTITLNNSENPTTLFVTCVSMANGAGATQGTGCGCTRLCGCHMCCLDSN
jgi:hypothetical protein